MNRFTGLLEVLQYQTGCMYLSDLHIPDRMPLILHALRKINPESYHLREWTDAVCYITGQNVRFERISDAVRYLEEYTPENQKGEMEQIS